MDKKMEKKIGKIFRRLTQIAGFLIMPGLFTSTFFGIRDLVIAAVSGDFQIQELFPQLILVIVMTIGAILFGTPNAKSEVKKYHICAPCYADMLKLFTTKE